MKRALHTLLLAGLLFSSCGASGCVASDAGYADVRKLVSARSGHDVQWERHAGRSQSEKTTRALLAKPLTAEAAAQLALLNNPSLQAAFEDLGVARADLVTALAVPNPNAEAALRFGRGRDEPAIELSVTQSLSQLFFLPVRNSAARAGLDAAKLSVGIAALDLALQTRTAFYMHQANEQILELRRSVLRAARASFEAAARLHEAGNVTELAFANEQALYEEARLDTAQAETALVESKQRLNALMGLWGAGVGWQTRGRLSEPVEPEAALEQVEQRAIRQSIDLELARRRYAAASKSVNVARTSGWVPELRAGVAAERDESDWEFGPVVELELPLFYQGQGAAARSQAEASRQQHLSRSVAIGIRAQARFLTNRVLAARERVDYYRTVLLPLRQRIVDETELQYNAMAIGVFQLLQAKRDQIETGRTYVEALRDYWITRAEIEQLLAGRLVRGGFAADTPAAAPSTADEAPSSPSSGH
ncbi:MAG TPA: TolC family protein [Polyangiaceae bacterium]|nr:TolC family protein [Polyangiaceae bacterium]